MISAIFNLTGMITDSYQKFKKMNNSWTLWKLCNSEYIVKKLINYSLKISIWRNFLHTQESIIQLCSPMKNLKRKQ